MAAALAKGLARSAEEFVSQALRNQAEELAYGSEVKNWLRETVVPSHNAFMRDITQGKSADDTLAEVLAD